MKTLAELLDALRRFRLLEPADLDRLPRQEIDPRTLARQLVQQGLLTPFQVNKLFTGRGAELVLSSYVLLELLGEGGMGAVYKARNWKLGHTVALKLIRKERLTNAAAIKRFQREIRASSALDHPHIVRALDADEVQGTHILVMEYVEGGTDLSKLVRANGPLPIDEACRFIRQVALGLQHAFERGLVHRDIKPHNLMVSAAKPQAVVKVADFGLARLGESDEESSTLTQEGAVMGTLDYLAPEQARDSHTADIRADLYSLGCTFYYLLAGRAPFVGGTAAEKMYKHQFENPAPVELVRMEVPGDVADVVRRLMAKQPEDRYQTPAALAVDLEAILSGRSVSAVGRSGAKAGGSLQTLPVGPNPFADLSKSETAVETPTRVPAPPAQPVRAGKGVAALVLGVGVGGVALVAAVVVVVLIAFSGGEQMPPKDDGKLRLPPPTPAPNAADIARAEENRRRQDELDKQKRLDDEEKQRQNWHAAEDALRAKRAEGAEEPFKLLEAGFHRKGVSFAAFAKEVAAFKAKHGGTPAAVRATQLLMKLPSPLDGLNPQQVPQDCAAEWRAEGRAPPEELVGVLGEHQRRHWNGAIIAVGFAADGTIVSVGANRVVRHWHLGTGHERIVKLEGVPFPPGTAVLSPDARTVVLGGDSLMLWNTATGKEAPALAERTAYAWTNFTFSSDGATLLASNYCVAGQTNPRRSLLRTWSLSDGKSKGSLTHTIAWPHLHPVAISRDGQTAYVSVTVVRTATESVQAVKRIDLGTGKESVLLKGQEPTHLALSPDDRTLVIATGWQILLWDTVQNKEHGSFAGTGPVAFSPDGQLIASRDGKIVKAMTGELLATVTAGGVPAFSRDGRQLATGGGDGIVRLWDVASGKELQPLAGPTGPASAVQFSPDGQSLLTAHGDGTIQSWNVATMKRESTLTVKPHPLGTPYWFSPDGRSVAFSDSVNVLVHCDVARPRLDSAGKLGGTAPTAGGFSPDGRSLAMSLAGDPSVKQWRVETGALSWSNPWSSARCLGFHPDGRSVAVGCSDGKVRFLDANNGKELGNLVHSGIVAGTFAPDGLTVALVADKVTLWDLRTGRQRRKLDTAEPVAFSPDGNLFVTWGAGVRIWDSATGMMLKHFVTPGAVKHAAFAPDGRHLATANSNGTVYVLRLPKSVLPPPALAPAEAKTQQDDGAKKLGLGDRADALTDHGWFRDNAPDRTRPVASLPANAWGLHDMHGNVWEWCGDTGRNYGNEPVRDPFGTHKPGVRALRGGGVSTAGVIWSANALRSASRLPDFNALTTGNKVGFRVLCEIDAKMP